MKISPAIVQHLFEEMRKQQMIHVKGSTGLDYSFELTEAGRAFAAERSETSKYAGPVPVSLNEYFRAVGLQAAKVKVNRTDLRTAFADLVVPDSLLDQLGPALVSQRSLFLYGPTGNGKTSYSERLTRIYQDSILVPYALEVDGQIITVYDPVVHHKLNIDDPNLDARWVVCQRPCVIVGGELVSSMLDLRSDESSGTYVAPLQVKANNGILVIDDLGRQAMHPRELLNRCMTPLSRRIDYLNLSYGIKFEIPFELLVVFSTNLNPADLADEAFLRRIPNKVYVDNIDDRTFDVIFGREATKQEIAWDAEVAETVRRLCRMHGGEHLRACYPGDICSILHWISEYEGRPIEATEAELERGVRLYFARS
jgi:predicted ATPase with chaperone activity